MPEEAEPKQTEGQEPPKDGVVVYRETNDEGAVRVTWGILGEVDPMAVPALLRRAARDAEAALGVG